MKNQNTAGRRITREEHIARMVVCRANDVDPYVPDTDIEKLFVSFDGGRAVGEIRKALFRERWLWGGAGLVFGFLVGAGLALALALKL